MRCSELFTNHRREENTPRKAPAGEKKGAQPKHKQCLRLRVIPEHVAVSSVRLLHLQLAAIIPVFTFKTSWKVSMGFPQGGGDAATMTKH